MTGREKKEYNDLFFVCSLVEYIARKTKNRRRDVVNALGENNLRHIYDLADVYHCENIDKLTDEWTSKCRIAQGSFDNVAQAQYRVPTHWDMGKVYHRLIIRMCAEQNLAPVAALIVAYNSPIADKIDDYNSSMYYENTDYLYASFLMGVPA